MQNCLVIFSYTNVRTRTTKSKKKKKLLVQNISCVFVEAVVLGEDGPPAADVTTHVIRPCDVTVSDTEPDAASFGERLQNFELPVVRALKHKSSF